MKRFKLLSVLLVCIALLSGCGAETAQTEDTALPTEDNATEITIEVGENSLSFYKNAARKFEAETGVKVNVISASNDDTARTRIQAELMAGKGADIYASIYLGLHRHRAKRTSVQSRELGRAGPLLFQTTTFYMNLLGSRFDEGDLYSLLLLMHDSNSGVDH